MRIDRRSFAGRHCAGGKGRYAIDNTQILKDGSAVTTNGRALMVIQTLAQSSQPLPNDLMIKPDLVAAVVKDLPLRGKQSALIQQCDRAGTCVRITTPKKKHETPLPDCMPYPHWRDVVPKESTGVGFTVHLPIEALADLMKSIKESIADSKGRDDLRSVEITFAGEKQPAVFRFAVGKESDDRRGVAVLMPSANREVRPLTDWEKKTVGLKGGATE